MALLRARIGFPRALPPQGRGAGRSFLATVKKHVEFLEFVPKQYLADRDKVIALGHYVFRMRVNGRTITSDWLHSFTHRDAKVVKFREFLDTAQLAEAYRG
jgi:ketosteroid isomerase-like protein